MTTTEKPTPQRWIEVLQRDQFQRAQDLLIQLPDETLDFDEIEGDYVEGSRYCCIGVLGRMCGLTDRDMIGRGILLPDEADCETLPDWYTALDHEAISGIASRNDDSTDTGKRNWDDAFVADLKSILNADEGFLTYYPEGIQ